MTVNNIKAFFTKQYDKLKQSDMSITKHAILIILAVLLLINVVFRVIAVKDVIGSSMEPTVHDKQTAITTHWFKPKRGDIVIIRHKDTSFIKRVVALPGETIKIKDTKTYINNKRLQEPYIKGKMEYNSILFEPKHLDYSVDELNYSYTYKVPSDALYALGDNRNDSWDSRHYGAFKTKDVTDKVILLLPVSYNIYKSIVVVLLVFMILVILLQILDDSDLRKFNRRKRKTQTYNNQKTRPNYSQQTRQHAPQTAQGYARPQFQKAQMLRPNNTQKDKD